MHLARVMLEDYIARVNASPPAGLADPRSAVHRCRPAGGRHDQGCQVRLILAEGRTCRGHCARS